MRQEDQFQNSFFYFKKALYKVKVSGKSILVVIYLGRIDIIQ